MFEINKRLALSVFKTIMRNSFGVDITSKSITAVDISEGNGKVVVILNDTTVYTFSVALTWSGVTVTDIQSYKAVPEFKELINPEDEFPDEIPEDI